MICMLSQMPIVLVSYPSSNCLMTCPEMPRNSEQQLENKPGLHCLSVLSLSLRGRTGMSRIIAEALCMAGPMMTSVIG